MVSKLDELRKITTVVADTGISKQFKNIHLKMLQLTLHLY